MLTLDDMTNGSPLCEEIKRDFNALYYFATYEGQKVHQVYWMGVPVLKAPTDLWTYQEILFDLRPDLIIECGVWCGGSSLYYYTIGQLMGGIDVLGIDIDLSNLNGIASNISALSGGRLSYLEGSSIDPKTIEIVRQRAAGKKRVMVILDSAHDYAHVKQELALYAPLVSEGQHLVVEDTNVDLLCAQFDMAQYFNNGPGTALREFLLNEPKGRWFENQLAQRHFVTFHPGGFLRRMPDQKETVG